MFLRTMLFALSKNTTVERFSNKDITENTMATSCNILTIKTSLFSDGDKTGSVIIILVNFLEKSNLENLSQISFLTIDLCPFAISFI